MFWALLLGFSLYSEPVVCGVGLVIMLTGVPVYFLGVHWKEKPKCIYRFIGRWRRGSGVGRSHAWRLTEVCCASCREGDAAGPESLLRGFPSAGPRGGCRSVGMDRAVFRSEQSMRQLLRTLHSRRARRLSFFILTLRISTLPLSGAGSSCLIIRDSASGAEWENACCDAQASCTFYFSPSHLISWAAQQSHDHNLTVNSCSSSGLFPVCNDSSLILSWMLLVFFSKEGVGLFCLTQDYTQMCRTAIIRADHNSNTPDCTYSFFCHHL